MSERERVEQPNGVVLQVWESKGKKWVCAASDHGPLCRLCQPVDEITEACLSSVMDGMMICMSDPDGGLLFRVTEAGKRRVGHMLSQETVE